MNPRPHSRFKIDALDRSATVGRLVNNHCDSHTQNGWDTTVNFFLFNGGIMESDGLYFLNKHVIQYNALQYGECISIYAQIFTSYLELMSGDPG